MAGVVAESPSANPCETAQDRRLPVNGTKSSPRSQPHSGVQEMAAIGGPAKDSRSPSSPKQLTASSSGSRRCPQLLTPLNATIASLSLFLTAASVIVAIIANNVGRRQAEMSLDATLWRDCVDLQVNFLYLASRNVVVNSIIGSS